MNKNEAESVIKDTIEYANTEIMKNKKRCFRIVITVIVFAILVTSLIGSCFISYVTFNIGNPFAVASGYFQITVLDKKYVSRPRFEDDEEIRMRFLKEFVTLFSDGQKRRLVLEVNSSNEDLQSIIADLVSVGVKFE